MFKTPIKKSKEEEEEMIKKREKNINKIYFIHQTNKVNKKNEYKWKIKGKKLHIIYIFFDCCIVAIIV